MLPQNDTKKGRSPTVNADLSGSKVPFYIGHTAMSNGNIFVEGEGLKVLTSSHQLLNKDSGNGLDMLNGALIVPDIDGEGKPMFRYSDPTKPLVQGVYSVGSGAPGAIHTPLTSTNGSDGVFTGGTALLGNSITANFIAILSCWVPKIETVSQNLFQVGFDFGGWTYTTGAGENVSGAIGINLNDPSAQSGATDTQGPNGNWNGAYCGYPSLGFLANDERMVRVVAVNGTGNVFGSYTNNSGRLVNKVTGANFIGNTSVGTGWSTSGVGGNSDPCFINLGQGLSTGFGINFMAIINSTNAISQGDIDRICAFVGKSGEFPYWLTS